MYFCLHRMKTIITISFCLVYSLFCFRSLAGMSIGERNLTVCSYVSCSSTSGAVNQVSVTGKSNCCQLVCAHHARAVIHTLHKHPRYHSGNGKPLKQSKPIVAGYFADYSLPNGSDLIMSSRLVCVQPLYVQHCTWLV